MTFNHLHDADVTLGMGSAIAHLRNIARLYEVGLGVGFTRTITALLFFLLAYR